MTTAFASVLAALAVLIVLAVTLLGHPRLAPTKELTPNDWFNLIKLIFAVIAGGGGVVALVVAYRRQRVIERSHELDQHKEKREQTRLFTERFTAVAEQLGSANAAVQMAGVYAMAGLADDWIAHRQTCIDVLCGYLRMSYPLHPEVGGTNDQQLAWRHDQEVRHAVIRVITAHLRDDATVTWQGRNFDFTGVIFDGGDFSTANFSSGIALFDWATFSNTVLFRNVRFGGATVSFDNARFLEGSVIFDGADICAGTVSFDNARFQEGSVTFERANISGGALSFNRSQFSGGRLSFGQANISVTVSFVGIRVEHEMLHFNGANIFRCKLDFNRVEFLGGTVRFAYTRFQDCEINFGSARFASGMITFPRAKFINTSVTFLMAQFMGSNIHFAGASVDDGLLDFSRVRDWSKPPSFAGLHANPEVLKLPILEKVDVQDQAEAEEPSWESPTEE